MEGGRTSFDALYVADHQPLFCLLIELDEAEGLTEVLTNGGYPYKASYTIVNYILSPMSPTLRSQTLWNGKDSLITPSDHQSQLNPYPCPLITSGAGVSLDLMYILTHVRIGPNRQLPPLDQGRARNDCSVGKAMIWRASQASSQPRSYRCSITYPQTE